MHEGCMKKGAALNQEDAMGNHAFNLKEDSKSGVSSAQEKAEKVAQLSSELTLSSELVEKLQALSSELVEKLATRDRRHAVQVFMEREQLGSLHFFGRPRGLRGGCSIVGGDDRRNWLKAKRSTTGG